MTPILSRIQLYFHEYQNYSKKTPVYFSSVLFEGRDIVPVLKTHLRCAVFLLRCMHACTDVRREDKTCHFNRIKLPDMLQPVGLLAMSPSCRITMLYFLKAHCIPVNHSVSQINKVLWELCVWSWAAPEVSGTSPQQEHTQTITLIHNWN